MDYVGSPAVLALADRIRIFLKSRVPSVDIVLRTSNRADSSYRV